MNPNALHNPLTEARSRGEIGDGRGRLSDGLLEPYLSAIRTPFTTRITEVKSNNDIEPCLSVLVPVYNEEATAVPILQRVLQQRPVQELIVVDDESRDRTWERLQQFARTEPRLKLFRHEYNQGKGAALRTAIQH